MGFTFLCKSGRGLKVELRGSEQGRDMTLGVAKHTNPRTRWRIDRLQGAGLTPGRRFFSMASTYRSSDTIPVSGIYRVLHAQHRLPHEVTLVQGQTFPPCAKCRDEVTFELVRGVPALERERRGSVSLYALPVIEDEDDAMA